MISGISHISQLVSDCPSSHASTNATKKQETTQSPFSQYDCLFSSFSASHKPNKTGRKANPIVSINVIMTTATRHPVGSDNGSNVPTLRPYLSRTTYFLDTVYPPYLFERLMPLRRAAQCVSMLMCLSLILQERYGKEQGFLKSWHFAFFSAHHSAQTHDYIELAFASLGRMIFGLLISSHRRLFIVT
jgi:hypothetical protein